CRPPAGRALSNGKGLGIAKPAGLYRRHLGVGQAFRAVNPQARLIAVEPNESCTIQCGQVAKHSIEGISDGFVPAIYNRNRHLVDQVIAVDSDEAVAEMRSLASHHGLFVGPSSGAHIVAARRVRAAHPELATIVTVFPDEG